MPRTRPEAEAGFVAFEEIGEVLGVDATLVMEYVELGLVHPVDESPGGALTAADVARLSRALRLSRELEVHAAAAAMLVELLEERESLRRRLACLEQSRGASV